MNKWCGTGRAVKDVNVKYSGDLAIARFTLAVNRRFKREGEQSADFISCVAFGKTGEFCEKFVRKGVKFDVEGRIQTGSYQDKDGRTVHTTDVIVENIEFGESKNASAKEATEEPVKDTTENTDEGFMNVPDEDDSLPFS